MRLPRIQFTVRQMMRATAVAGLLLGLGIQVVALQRRSESFRRSGQMYAAREKGARRGIRERRRPIGCFSIPQPGSASPEDLANLRTLADRFARRKAAYLHVARYPWLSVEPGTPEPK